MGISPLKRAILSAVGVVTVGAAAALFFYPQSVSAVFPMPNRYDDCVLESMKGVTSDVAARQITASCRNKYKDIQPRYGKDAPPETVAKINGRASFADGTLSGSIYNGNNDWTVTQVTVDLTTEVFDVDTQKMRSKTVAYNINEVILPLSSRPFSVTTAEVGQQTGWAIAAAKGTD